MVDKNISACSATAFDNHNDLIIVSADEIEEIGDFYAIGNLHYSGIGKHLTEKEYLERIEVERARLVEKWLAYDESLKMEIDLEDEFGLEKFRDKYRLMKQASSAYYDQILNFYMAKCSNKFESRFEEMTELQKWASIGMDLAELHLPDEAKLNVVSNINRKRASEFLNTHYYEKALIERCNHIIETENISWPVYIKFGGLSKRSQVSGIEKLDTNRHHGVWIKLSSLKQTKFLVLVSRSENSRVERIRSIQRRAEYFRNNPDSRWDNAYRKLDSVVSFSKLSAVSFDQSISKGHSGD